MGTWTDIKQVHGCTSGKIGPFALTATLSYVDEEIESKVTWATENEDDFKDWFEAMSVHSLAVARHFATWK